MRADGEVIIDKVVLVDRVTKIFTKGSAEIRALDEISLEISTGEFVSIMGSSGSGKSTFLHLVGALDAPTSGEIFLEGKPLSTLSDDALSDIRREKIGYIFQQFNLLPTLTAHENVALPALLAGRARKEDSARVLKMLEAVEMGDRLNHRPEELSGGEMQRVAIARALAMRPAVILADEPTGNLDSRTGEEVLGLLKSCQEDFGQTIVMVTHDPKAAAYADRIVTLKDGRVLEVLDAAGA